MADEKPSCEQVMNLFPNPFVIIDQHYTIVAANQQYIDQFGAIDIVGHKCHKVSHHSDVPCSKNGEVCPLETVFEQQQASEVMHIHYDRQGNQEYVQLKAMPIFDDAGELKYMGEMINPIDEYRETGALLVGRSRSIMRMISLLQRVAPTSCSVLLEGESGVGKECAAQYLHEYSNYQKGPFVVVDCANLGEGLIESELFGYEKGAFTGATVRKSGLIEAANGGTLFIDEIGEMPLPLQTKLLRILETGTFRRVGGTDYVKVDVRIVAATHRHLKDMVDEARFRQDLYYRLAAFPVAIPSLRERTDDIFLLAQHFFSQFGNTEQYLPLSVEVIEKLMSYDYPGNVRELRNILERAAILAADDVITPDHIVLEDNRELGSVSDAAAASDDASLLLRKRGKVARDEILSALRKANGHRKQAADLLGVSERTLYRYVQQIKIQA